MSPSLQGRVRTFCTVARRNLPLASPSPQGRVGTAIGGLVCCYCLDVAVPSRSGRDHWISPPRWSGSISRRPLKVGSEQDPQVLGIYLSAESPSPQGRVGTKLRRSYGWRDNLTRRPLKVGSGQKALRFAEEVKSKSPSPQGRVKLSCGLSVES